MTFRVLARRDGESSLHSGLDLHGRPIHFCRAVSTLIPGLIVVLSLIGVIGCDRSKAASTPPPIVTVAHPVSRSVTDYLDFTGNTVAVDSVTLVARVEGFLEKVNFT